MANPEKLTTVRINDIPMSEKNEWVNRANNSEFKKLVPWIRDTLNKVDKPLKLKEKLTPDQFKRIRKRMKLTQQDLAEKFNYTRQHIILFEKGKESIPKIVCIALSALALIHEQDKKIT